MKQCIKCKEGKDESEFYKDKNNKNGLKNDCKECCNKKDKKNHGEHKEERNQKAREYNENNREELNQKGKENIKSPLPYNSTIKIRKEIEGYEEIKESENGNTACRCAYDGGGFESTKRQIQDRLVAINEGEGAENRLYCSEACKQSCPTYKKRGYERGYEPASSREVQPELRKMRFAEDNGTCQKCGRTRSALIKLGLTLHCHHKEGIQGNPIESADVDECITYCKECHGEVHKKEGCKPSDMQCPADLKYDV